MPPALLRLLRPPDTYKCFMQELIRSWRRDFARAPGPSDSAPPRRSYLRQFDGISELGSNVAEGAAEAGREEGGRAGGEEIPFLIVQLSADVNLQGLLGRQRRAQLSALALPRVAVVPGGL